MAFINLAPVTSSITRPSIITSRTEPSSIKQQVRVSRVSGSSSRARLVRMDTNVETFGGGMQVIRQADEATIEALSCRSWGTWGCEPSKFPWTYSNDEVCLVLSGDFTVIPDGGGKSMDVKQGDIAYFPQGMSCTWEVRSEVNKHFKFGIKLLK